MLLTITSDTWIVTGLGFGIVLTLLFCLVFVLQFFGWIMQRLTAPKAPKAPTAPQAEKPVEEQTVQQPVSGNDEVDDTPAIAMALYLASLDVKHDMPTPMISLKNRETAWNTKTIGLN